MTDSWGTFKQWAPLFLPQQLDESGSSGTCSQGNASGPHPNSAYRHQHTPAVRAMPLDPTLILPTVTNTHLQSGQCLWTPPSFCLLSPTHTCSQGNASGPHPNSAYCHQHTPAVRAMPLDPTLILPTVTNTHLGSKPMAKALPL